MILIEDLTCMSQLAQPEWQREIISLFFFSIRSWFLKKVACSAWLHKKTNKTPFRKSKLDPKQVKANMRSVSSSSASPVTLSGVLNRILLHWRLVLPEVSFLDPLAQNATSGCWEERFYLPARQATARWRLTARFAPCLHCEVSLQRCSREPAHQGSQTLLVPASFSCRSFCSALADLLPPRSWKWDKEDLQTISPILIEGYRLQKPTNNLPLLI